MIKRLLKISTLRFRHILLALFILWVFSIVWQFVIFSQSDVDVYVRDDSRPEDIEGVVCGENDRNTRLFPTMAALSAYSYQEKQPSEFEDWLFVFEGITESLSTDRYLVPGLKFTLWANHQDKTLVVVFRGTSGLVDFHSNLHWLFKMLPYALDQYEQVPLILDLLDDYIPNGYKVYAAGHSLGGGLAQYALYYSPKITIAYVFNTTPVTGWTDLDSDQRMRNVKGNRVYRVHENGEVLEFLRLVMKAGYVLSPLPNRNPYFKEYRLNLLDGNLIFQHNIQQLSESLLIARSCDEGMERAKVVQH